MTRRAKNGLAAASFLGSWGCLGFVGYLCNGPMGAMSFMGVAAVVGLLLAGATLLDDGEES